MHHISVSVFLCRPWLRWRWLTRRSLTPTACRCPVRCAQSSTHASSLWQRGENDSLLSLYLLESEHVDLSVSLSHMRILLTSDSSDIPLVPVCVINIQFHISRAVFTPEFSHHHLKKCTTMCQQLMRVKRCLCVHFIFLYLCFNNAETVDNDMIIVTTGDQYISPCLLFSIN